MKSFAQSFKAGLLTLSVATLAACGGGGDVVVVVDDNHHFLSVDNLNISNGVVCIEDIFLDANTPAGQQVARDLADFYKTRNLNIALPYHLAYSAPTYCNGPTSNYVPTAGLIISANYYYNVIIPSLR